MTKDKDCNFCNSCNSCDSCDSCDYCDYCNFCNFCNSCNSCENLVNGFMCNNLKLKEKDKTKFWRFNKEVTKEEWDERSVYLKDINQNYVTKEQKKIYGDKLEELHYTMGEKTTTFINYYLLLKTWLIYN